MFLILLISLIVFLPQLYRKDLFKILALLFLSGTVGILFFKGNSGVVYDYYFTGYYLVFLFLVASTLGHLWRFKLGKIFVIYFIYVFLARNLEIIWFKVSDQGTNENSVAYLNQKKAIDWVYENAEEEEFNVDVYVPPVIPYAYDYLFLWYPTTLKLRGASGELVKEQVPLLYTLYEVDPPHPERLEAWLARQQGIGKVEESARFGGITVERRRRI